MEQKLKAVVAEILGIKSDDVVDELSPENAGNWDSLNHMNIITAVEMEFNLSMSMSDIQSIDNFKSLKSLVEELSQ